MQQNHKLKITKLFTSESRPSFQRHWIIRGGRPRLHSDTVDGEALETMKFLPSLCIYLLHNVFNWRNPPEEVNRASFVAPQAVSSQSDV